ncbi:hypothetical protein LCGC14_2834230, partial [marine sediment metagenome]
MAFDLSSITSEARVRAPRIILLGVEKIGKSTFAAGADSSIFLPIKGEEGIDEFSVPKTPVCDSLDSVLGWLFSLGRGEHSHQTVVIDSTSTLESIVHRDICTKAEAPSINEGALAFGVGTDRANHEWRKITVFLDALRSDKNMTSILIGHVKVKRFDDPNGESYDQYQWDIHHKAASLLCRWADSILFCNTKVVVTKESLGFHEDNARNVGRDIAPGSRFLYTQKRPAHPGGGRGVYGRLSYELPLSWANFRNAVAGEKVYNRCKS